MDLDFMNFGVLEIEFAISHQKIQFLLKIYTFTYVFLK